MTRSVKKFTRLLQDEPDLVDVNNFYKAKRQNLQRYNLDRYLAHMMTLQPEVILVGEAPGYNGCRLTGIPFTSEDIVFKGVCDGKLFGSHNGYKASAIKAQKEQSASAMWSVLQEYDSVPLLWNAFPFHPYKPGNPFSNRKPNAKELHIGKAYLFTLMKLFPIKKVIAVGNVASQSLKKMGIEHHKVRHPSYGGKALFKEQLRYNLSYLNSSKGKK